MSLNLLKSVKDLILKSLESKLFNNKFVNGKFYNEIYYSENPPEVEKELLSELRLLLNYNSDYIDPYDLQFFKFVGTKENKIRFESTDRSVEEKINLKSLKFISQDVYGYNIWEADTKEYHETYNSSFSNFLNSEILGLINSINTSSDRDIYFEYLSDYIKSINTLHMTLKEELDDNGSLSNGIKLLAMDLLNNFIGDYVLCKTNIETENRVFMEEKYKSRIDRLEFELAYIKERKEGIKIVCTEKKLEFKEEPKYIDLK